MAEKSEYELLREQNMARNALVMKSLGLDASDFTAHLNHQNKSTTTESKPKKKAPKRKFQAEEVGVERRSARLLGNSSDLLMMEDTENGEVAITQKPARVQSELRGSAVDHDLAEAEHLRWAGKQGKVTIVGTASYKHTLMRVRTMNEAGLGRRIKAIERASGQHAVVKMRLFARVLCLEGYDDLAFEANESLERLVIKLGDPEYGPPDDDEETKQGIEEDVGPGGTCPACTFLNQHGTSRCHVCSTLLVKEFVKDTSKVAPSTSSSEPITIAD